MSSLEEKLKRISGELQAYKPLDDETRPEHQASCIHDITEYNLEETSGGLLSYADEDTVRVICRSDFTLDWDISRAAFVDTETTGLSGGSGTVAFLIGLGYVSGEKFVVEQFFMEDYDVEGEMLSRLCKKLQGFDWLVTFNGKCFDTPLIASRAVINRISAPLEDMEQVDLLHAARRIYKKRLRQCNLQNLEREVLGHEREHDVPGSLVPIMFFEYLRSGDFEPMKLVLEHNRRDIVSLLTLLCKLCYAVKAPETLGHADDIYSCGRLNERLGRLDEAEKCYQLAGQDSGTGAKELSLLLRRQGRHAEASALWLQMCASGQYGLFPYLELAKYYEHQDKNPQIALDIVEECVVKLRSMGFSPDSDEYKSLARRRERLMAKLDEKEK